MIAPWHIRGACWPALPGTSVKVHVARPVWRRVEKAGLAIVGASAAGLAAAVAAARAGADVLLVEAREEIGTPPAPAIVGFDFLWPAQVERPPSTVRRRLDGVRLRAADGRGPFVEAPLSLFDRAAFDRHLADEARRAGARVLLGARGLEAREDRTLVADGVEVRAPIVLFADGASSQAARFLRSTRDPDSLAWGAVLEVEAPGADARELTITIGAHAEGGRSQLNPLGGGRWSHWTFYRGDAAQAEARARRALALDARLMGWPADAPARFAGVAPDPVYTLPGRLVADGVLVAGGAAGQGGLEVGLSSGWMAGETAARALASGRSDRAALRAYEDAWRKRYQRGYERLRRVADGGARLTDAELSSTLGAWEGRALPVDALGSWRALARHPRGALALARAAFLAQARA